MTEHLPLVTILCAQCSRHAQYFEKSEAFRPNPVVVEDDLREWPIPSTASKSLKTFVPRPLIVVLPVPSEQRTMCFMVDFPECWFGTITVSC
jgi:hypothetical protein